MVDKYQDTNYIQEQLVFLIVGNRKNITVLGDDDQGLYRFRGATIRNILEFPSKFNFDECKRVSLITNYRSDSKIVDFYNKWISTTDGYDFKFSWDNFRFNTGLIYQLFEFSPFKEILDNDLQNGVRDSRPIRNLSILPQIVAKFEYLHNIVVLTKKNIDSTIEKFFNVYMYFLYNGGINEYEDDSEYAPSGCISFLTIHQSKGMEFPIVVVGSLGNLPRDRSNDILDEIELKYFHRKSFEPKDRIKFFDFWRLYYTAFSRAQDLLVLTCNEHNGHGRTPSKYFQEVYNPLISFENPNFNIKEFDFKEVKKINIKETYSFISHKSVYNTCALQYKFFKELGFTPVRVGGTVFGTLVHQTIEDIHRVVLRHEENFITTENIKKWFNINYTNITNKEHTYLAER